MSKMLYSLEPGNGQEMLFEEEKNFVKTLRKVLKNNGELLEEGIKQIIIVRMVKK